MPRFIHLRVHSAYSLLEGAIPMKALPGLVAGQGFPAVAVTDTNNLFGALELSEGAAKAGVQPIIGLQLAIAYLEAEPGKKPPEPAPVALYAQDEAGYRNLMALSSAAYLETDTTRTPRVALDRLAQHAEGVICLTGGPRGPLGHLIANGRDARPLARRLAEIFPSRLYVEIQRHGTGGRPRTEAEDATEPGLVRLAYELDLPLVGTCEVFYASPDMHDAHDAFRCIGQGAYVNQSDRDRLTPEHWLKSESEMVALFADMPEAAGNTLEIAMRCAYRPRTRGPILPRFAKDEVDELRAQAREGLAARLAVIPHAAPAEEYEKRLDFELDVIESMGFPATS